MIESIFCTLSLGHVFHLFCFFSLLREVLKPFSFEFRQQRHFASSNVVVPSPKAGFISVCYCARPVLDTPGVVELSWLVEGKLRYFGILPPLPGPRMPRVLTRSCHPGGEEPAS